MSAKTKKILGIILVILLSVSLFIGLTAIGCIEYAWWLSALIVLGTYIGLGIVALIIGLIVYLFEG